MNKEETMQIYEPMEDAIYIEGEQDLSLQASVGTDCMPLKFNVIYIGNKITDDGFNNIVSTFDNNVNYASEGLLDVDIIKTQYIKRNSAMSNNELMTLLNQVQVSADGGVIFSEYFDDHLGMPFTLAPYDVWIINAKTSINPTYLTNVAIHEMGHGVGLAHNNDNNDVMSRGRNRFVKPKFSECSLDYIENSYLTNKCYEDKLLIGRDKVTCNVVGGQEPIDEPEPQITTTSSNNELIILGVIGMAFMFMMVVI